jgi:hypothetical protein
VVSGGGGSSAAKATARRGCAAEAGEGGAPAEAVIYIRIWLEANIFLHKRYHHTDRSKNKLKYKYV